MLRWSIYLSTLTIHDVEWLHAFEFLDVQSAAINEIGEDRIVLHSDVLWHNAGTILSDNFVLGVIEDRHERVRDVLNDSEFFFRQ